MNQPLTCPQCGCAIPPEVMVGLCPQCAARVAMRSLDSDGAASESGLALPKVRYFGDYELLEQVGRGGMGVVFKARQTSLNRLVAVKMILAGELATEDQVRRFHLEAEAAANLQHPNIVAIHEVGVHEGRHYFSMDYVDGPNLAQLTRERPLPPDRAARYVQLIAEGVHYAHQHGTLHRDLKPSNILIDSADQPRITDFGLAKRLTDPQPSTIDPQLTLTGQVLGAPSYMPPEQAGGHRGQLTAASDVYALGAILYHLLTARPPLLGRTAAETLVLVQTREPQPPRELNPAIPRGLEAICLKCLRKHPRDRYASAAALAEDLRRWQAGETTQARPAAWFEGLVRWLRRQPRLAVLGSSVAGVLLVAWLGSRGCSSGLDNRAGKAAPEKPLGRAVGGGTQPGSGATPAIGPLSTGDLLFVSFDDNVWRGDFSAGTLHKLPERTDGLTVFTGGTWRRLPVRASALSVSPNMRSLCYNRTLGSDGRLYVSDLEGRDEQLLTDHSLGGCWLDDDTIIYHWGGETDYLRSVWSISVRTRRKQKLFDWTAVRPGGYAGTLCLSPDHTHLLTNPQQGQRSQTQDLFVCDLHGQNVRVIWQDPVEQICDTAPVWLKGDRFAWRRYAEPGPYVTNCAIVTCRLGETNYTALTESTGRKLPIAGSPDGTRILFFKEVSDEVWPWHLWIMNADGQEARPVAPALKCKRELPDQITPEHPGRWEPAVYASWVSSPAH